jgi:hypothetical protein
MAYRPAQIYTGTGWDDIGDPRVGTVQTDVTNLQNGKLAYETPLTNQSGTTYTFALADARRITRATNAAAKTFTIPPQTSVTWANNTIIRVFNAGAGALTVNGGSGVTVTNTAKTLLQYESASLIRTGSNAWTLAPFGGTPDLDTAANRNFKSFTSSGSTTVPIWAKKMYYAVLGGGGNGAAGGGTGGAGGNGGQLTQGNIAVNGGTSLTITVGGAAASSSVAVSGGSTFTGTGAGGAAGGSGSADPPTAGSTGAAFSAPLNIGTAGGGGGGGGWANRRHAAGGATGGGAGGKNGDGCAGAGPGYPGHANSGGGGGGGGGFSSAQGGGAGGSGLVLLYFS